MQDFLLYPLLIFFIIFIIFGRIHIELFIKGKNRLNELSFDGIFLVSLMSSTLFAYYQNNILFKQVCTNISVLLLYGVLIIIFLSPILVYIFKRNKFIMGGVFLFLYLSLVIILYFVNIELSNKEIKNEYNYRIVGKYEVLIKSKTSTRYAEYIKFCSNDNEKCLSLKVYDSRYVNLKINQTIKVIKYNGYLGICWWEIKR